MKLTVSTLVLITLVAIASGGFRPLAGAISQEDDTLRPVRPGEPGARAFWNTHARRFIYPPAFELPRVDGAAKYRFTIKAGDGSDHTFTADVPWADLSPVWKDITEGHTTLTVQGIDATGKNVGPVAEKVFYRSPAFSGKAGDPLKPYAQAGREGLRAIYEAPHVQHWLEHGALDRKYQRYCYPNKIIGGLLRGMTAYSQVADTDEHRAGALKIARLTADYLMSLRFPADAAYAHVAPTYALNVDKPARAVLTIDRERDRWLMVPSTIDAALGFLDLYDVTRDQKYLDTASQMADTLVKTQESDGTWPLMVDWQTGKPVAPQRMIPTWVIFYFDRLERQYGMEQYRDARARAWKWIVDNPLKTYQWDAQFEDVILRPPYRNLAREQACDVALLLLSDPKRTPQDVAQAEELLRFAEDQFVVWKKPDPQAWTRATGRKNGMELWIAPCVLEQYAVYGPVARSAAILINTYLKAHEVTQKPVYLEKARALGNGMLEGQAWLAENHHGNGEIPTWNMTRAPINWLNNSFYAAESVLNLANHAAAERRP